MIEWLDKFMNVQFLAKCSMFAECLIKYSLTCLLKILSISLRRELVFGWCVLLWWELGLWPTGSVRSRSGVLVPLGPNTFRSLKHSVSIICTKQKRECSRVFDVRKRCLIVLSYVLFFQYLILPWDGHAARAELGVKVFICHIKVDSLHCGELVDIHNVMAVHGFWLWQRRT